MKPLFNPLGTHLFNALLEQSDRASCRMRCALESARNAHDTEHEREAIARAIAEAKEELKHEANEARMESLFTKQIIQVERIRLADTQETQRIARLEESIRNQMAINSEASTEGHSAHDTKRNTDDDFSILGTALSWADYKEYSLSLRVAVERARDRVRLFPQRRRAIIGEWLYSPYAVGLRELINLVKWEERENKRT